MEFNNGTIVNNSMDSVAKNSAFVAHQGKGGNIECLKEFQNGNNFYNNTDSNFERQNHSDNIVSGRQHYMGCQPAHGAMNVMQGGMNSSTTTMKKSTPIAGFFIHDTSPSFTRQGPHISAGMPGKPKANLRTPVYDCRPSMPIVTPTASTLVHQSYPKVPNHAGDFPHPSSVGSGRLGGSKISPPPHSMWAQQGLLEFERQNMHPVAASWVSPYTPARRHNGNRGMRESNSYVALHNSPPFYPEDRSMIMNMQGNRVVTPGNFVNAKLKTNAKENIRNHAPTPVHSKQCASQIKPQMEMSSVPQYSVPPTMSAPNKEYKKDAELDAANILCSFSKMKSKGDEKVENDFHKPDASAQKQRLGSYQEKGFDRKNKHKIAYSHHPTRLAMPSDVVELNRLHCFVRSELLEIVIVPEDTSENSSPSPGEKESEGIDFRDERENSTSEPSHSTLCGPVSSKESVHPEQAPSNKYYGGRVGLRCVHCAHTFRRPYVVNGKGTVVLDPETVIKNCNAAMGAFYPKSLSDLYRLVCTWQRVHFHKCRHVPPSIRSLYYDLKKGDKSRGKTKYWVISGMKLGLVDDEKGGGCIRYKPTVSMSEYPTEND